MLWKIVLVLGILGIFLGIAVTGISALLPIVTEGRTSWEEAMLGIIPGVLVLIVSFLQVPEELVAQVARHLAALGHRVDVFTRRDSEKLPGSGPGRYRFHVHRSYLFALLRWLEELPGARQVVIDAGHLWKDVGTGSMPRQSRCSSANSAAFRSSATSGEMLPDRAAS